MTIRLLDNNLVVPTQNPGQLRALFPQLREATIQGQTFCAVPHTLEAARVLNNIGIPAPSPIRTQYDWPGRYTPRWYQYDTAEFFTLYMRCYCHSSMRCVDKDTEFLTPTGWKKIPDYQEGDLVAQWVPETDQAEFVRPLEYINTPCDEFIHFKNSTGIDQMLTAEHRVPYYTPKGDVHEITAGKIHAINSKNSYGWSGKIPTTFHAPERGGLDLTDAEIRVMVMTIADGWFQNKTSRCHVRVKKDRKKSRARELLTNAGLPFQEYQKDHPTAVGYSIFRFTAPRREKEFTDFWWDATEAQLRVIVDEVRYWDSSPRRSTAFAFSAYKKSSAEFIQYAAVATKRVASLNLNIRERRGKTETEYVVYVRGNGTPLGLCRRSTRENTSSTIVPSSDGRCYCFSVPSTYIIFRRNGCVFVSGNTGKTLSALWAADYLRRAGHIQRTMIVAPLSTLYDVWQQNIFESFPLRTFAVLHGSRQKRLDLLAQPCDFYVVNHHGIGLIEYALKDRPDINHFIIDECAVMRNARNKRTREKKGGVLWAPLNEVLNNQGIVRSVWGMTGTPTPNEPTDAFGQCKLITPENYKGHFTSFKQETMMQLSQ
ncbi:MAG: SNF2-related protein, partial [Candidatus Neomarinimicrobiota bacterium]